MKSINGSKIFFILFLNSSGFDINNLFSVVKIITISCDLASISSNGFLLISEEIWNHLKDDYEQDIIISSWPKAKNSDISHNKDEISDFKEIVTSIRTIRSELNIPPSKKIDVIAYAKNELIKSRLNSLVDLIKSLSNSENLNLSLEKEKPENSAVAVCKSVELYIPLGDLVDKDEELAKLNKRLSELDSFILSIENKLSNDDFISKAPENIVSGEKNKLNDFLVERTKILSNIEVLK